MHRTIIVVISLYLLLLLIVLLNCYSAIRLLSRKCEIKPSISIRRNKKFSKID